MLEGEVTNPQDTLSILAVIVLYNVEPRNSPAFQSLMTAVQSLDLPQSKIEILLFDNSPNEGYPGTLPEHVRYQAAERNAGIAAAYNHALAMAQQENCAWLLTLDQDTTLPQDFLARMSALAIRWQDDMSVAAVVPQLVSGDSILSPNYVHSLWNTAVPRGFTGLNKRELYALNSAALLRVSSIREIGGFCEDFWLDQLDLVLHHHLHRAGKRTYVAGDIQVEHELSLQNYGSLSPDRFQNFLEAESAFRDLNKGPIENLALTAVLYLRYLKHKARGSNPAITAAILRVVKQRIFCGRPERIEKWRRSVRERAADFNSEERGRAQPQLRPRISVCMAAYNGEKYISTQLRSILSQLELDDEVIVVDDASTDDTCRIVESIQDVRVRLMRHLSNQGVLRSFEDAIRQASGDILFLADQDDLWMDDKVSTVLQVFRSNPDADIIASDAVLIDQDGTLTGPSYYATRGKFQTGTFANVLRCSYLGCTMAFRTRILSRILPFPKGMDILHDIWIGTSNSIAGGKTLYVDRPLVQYRRHKENATGNAQLTISRRLRVRWSLCRALTSSWLNLRRVNGH